MSLDGMDRHGKKDLNSQGLTGTSLDVNLLDRLSRFTVQVSSSMLD